MAPASPVAEDNSGFAPDIVYTRQILSGMEIISHREKRGFQCGYNMVK